MNLSMWRAFSLLRQTREPLAWWRRAFGAEFGKARPFLVACEGVAAASYPCPDTGIRLTVSESRGAYLAFPTGDQADAVDDLRLTWEDVQAWEIAQGAVRTALCDVLGLAKAPEGHGTGGDVDFLGTCNRHGRRRVYLCHAADGAGAVLLAGDAGRTVDAGCVLFAEREAAAELVLQARGVAGVALTECVTWDNTGLTGGCGEGCKGIGRQAVPANVNPSVVLRAGSEWSPANSDSAAVSRRLRAKRVAAGRDGRTVVKHTGDRKAIRAEVQRLLDGGLTKTEAYRQVAEQAQKGRAGKQVLTTKYGLGLEVASPTVVMRAFKSKW
jgi:hypothetical protein